MEMELLMEHACEWLTVGVGEVISTRDLTFVLRGLTPRFSGGVAQCATGY